MKNNKESIYKNIKQSPNHGSWNIAIEKINLRIESLLEKEEQILLAIDGKSGSGKSTLGEILHNIYNCNLFHMDDFFLPAELRTKARLTEVGGNVDYIRFKEEVINNILLDQEFQYSKFDCRIMGLTDTILVKPKRINIVEGSYSMHPSLIDNYNLKVFLDIDEDLQKDRILKRNGLVMLQKFVEEWIPKENIYFKKMKIRENSDLYFKY